MNPANRAPRQPSTALVKKDSPQGHRPTQRNTTRKHLQILNSSDLNQRKDAFRRSPSTAGRRTVQISRHGLHTKQPTTTSPEGRFMQSKRSLMNYTHMYVLLKYFSCSVSDLLPILPSSNSQWMLVSMRSSLSSNILHYPKRMPAISV